MIVPCSKVVSVTDKIEDRTPLFESVSCLEKCTAPTLVRPEAPLAASSSLALSVPEAPLAASSSLAPLVSEAPLALNQPTSLLLDNCSDVEENILTLDFLSNNEFSEELSDDFLSTPENSEVLEHGFVTCYTGALITGFWGAGFIHSRAFPFQFVPGKNGPCLEISQVFIHVKPLSAPIRFPIPNIVGQDVMTSAKKFVMFVYYHLRKCFVFDILHNNLLQSDFSEVKPEEKVTFLEAGLLSGSAKCCAQALFNTVCELLE